MYVHCTERDLNSSVIMYKNLLFKSLFSVKNENVENICTSVCDSDKYNIKREKKSRTERNIFLKRKKSAFHSSTLIMCICTRRRKHISPFMVELGLQDMLSFSLIELVAIFKIRIL